MNSTDELKIIIEGQEAEISVLKEEIRSLRLEVIKKGVDKPHEQKEESRKWVQTKKDIHNIITGIVIKKGTPLHIRKEGDYFWFEYKHMNYNFPKSEVDTYCVDIVDEGLLAYCEAAKSLSDELYKKKK